MDVDTRALRYFVVIAEEGNLTRAAQRLFVSQPALTKQLKQLESHLGTPLFTRSSSGMALTEAGGALVERAPDLLRSWDEAVLAAQDAARVLRVGFLASAANEATQDIVSAFSARRPGWRVDLRQSPWSDPTAGLRSGAVPVALVRLPFPGQEDYRVLPLFGEPRCVALSSGHPLASRDVIEFAELRDEPFVAAPGATGKWRDYWLGLSEGDSRTVTVGAVTSQPDEFFAAIANGYGIALVPESSARFYARPGVMYRPLNGISPSEVAVAWPPNTNEVVEDFIDCCLRHFRESP